MLSTPPLVPPTAEHSKPPPDWPAPDVRKFINKLDSENGRWKAIHTRNVPPHEAMGGFLLIPAANYLFMKLGLNIVRNV